MKITLVGVILFVNISNVLTLEPFTFNDFFSGKYSDAKWNGTWFSDTQILFRDNNNGDIKLFDVTKPSEKATTFISNIILANYKKPSISISKKKTLVLVKYEVKRVYRYSTLSKFAVLNATNKFSVVELPPEIKNVPLQTCRFSPVEDSLIAVKDNNILYIQLNEMKVQTVTTDGMSDVVYNGVPDWIYEEEVIGGDSALWPSPFNDNFAYAKFDDTNVREFQYPLYGEPGSYADVYPHWERIRYPKVGTPNAKFSVYIYNPNLNATQELSIFLQDEDSMDFLLYNVDWRTSTDVIVTLTNREQTISMNRQCTIDDGKCKEIMHQLIRKGWIEVKPLYIMEDSRVVENSRHVFGRIRVLDSNVMDKEIYETNLTIGKIIGEVQNKLYVEATLRSNHSQQHIYSLDLEQNGTKECLTCDMIAFKQNCLFAEGVLSPKQTYLTRICSGPGPTYVDIVDLTNDTEKPIVFMDNADLRKLLEQKTMPIIEDMTLSIDNTQFEAKVRLFLPPSMSTNKKYPMLVHVYAGPNSNQISDEYNIGLQHYLVAKKEYIYAFIDGRGSSNRGLELMHAVYKNLGGGEVDDQIITTKNLIRRLSYIDSKRVCIWGWSYGGFATAHVMARDKDTFICGASVAPVTNFIYYDSIYTERYMGLYDAKDADSVRNYNQTDVTKLAEKFRGKKYLLIHGTADENVHYQQSMQLARALERADVPFEQMSYPDEVHSLSGVKPHLYHMLDSFWDKAFEVDVLAKAGNDAVVAQQLNMLCQGEYKAVCCIVFHNCN